MLRDQRRPVRAHREPAAPGRPDGRAVDRDDGAGRDARLARDARLRFAADLAVDERDAAGDDGAQEDGDRKVAPRAGLEDHADDEDRESVPQEEEDPHDREQIAAAPQGADLLGLRGERVPCRLWSRSVTGRGRRQPSMSAGWRCG